MLILPKRSSSAGFSLIELMIAIAVMAIMMMVALPSYTQWMQNTQIRNAATSIQNGLQRARAEAVSRNASVQFVLGAGGDYWRVIEVSTGNTLDSKSIAEISAAVTLVVTPGGQTTVTFNSFGIGATAITQLDVDSNAIPAADSRELRIVNVGGAARMCDPNVSALTDSRHC